ncbi:DNA-binding response regulator, partial [Vibrio astriarenae]
VMICSPQEAVFRSHTVNIDLVFIDYDYLVQLESLGLLPDFDLLGWPLMVHNVPNSQVDNELLRWKFLKGILLRSEA